MQDEQTIPAAQSFEPSHPAEARHGHQKRVSRLPKLLRKRRV